MKGVKGGMTSSGSCDRGMGATGGLHMEGEGATVGESVTASTSGLMGWRVEEVVVQRLDDSELHSHNEEEQAHHLVAKEATQSEHSRRSDVAAVPDPTGGELH